MVIYAKMGDCGGIHMGLNERLQSRQLKEDGNVAAAFAAKQPDMVNSPNGDWHRCTGLSFAWATPRSTSKQG